MERVLHFVKKLIPQPVFNMVQPAYHFSLSLAGAVRYGFPSRRITVIGATGTKGKSSTLELLNAVLEADGRTTALASTIRFKIANKSERNLFKMTMPGRFFLQRFLRDAIRARCNFALIEMTSEGARQFRHRFIDMNALIFTNLSPEHIDSHGSFEKYKGAKLAIKRQLERSHKRPRFIIANADDPHSEAFLSANVEQAIRFKASDAEPYTILDNGTALTFDGISITSPLRGFFNLYNILAAAACAKAFGIDGKTIARGIQSLEYIPGRVERIEAPRHGFSVIIDYAHTPDSLTKLYEAFPNARKICVLGNAGGGRDRWKRPEMGRIAQEHCEHVILTNEDPYDEDPRAIVEEMAEGMTKKPEIILDRRSAIRRALQCALQGDVVLITGKGTDPYIMGPHGTKEAWSDATVVREESAALQQNTQPHV